VVVLLIFSFNQIGGGFVNVTFVTGPAVVGRCGNPR
jgi:hypothetical protein